MSQAPYSPKLSWRLKAIVPLIGATVVGVALLTFLVIHIQDQQLERDLTRRIETTSSLIEETIDSTEPAEREQAIQGMMELFGRQPDIWRAQLITPDGRVLYSSVPAEKGTTADPQLMALSRELLSSGGARVLNQRFLHRRNDVLIRSVHPLVLPTGETAVLAVESSLEKPLANQNEMRAQIILLAALGILALIAVMLFVLVVLVHRPVLELTEKIAQARRGKLDTAVSFADRRDEIGELGRDFNEMVRQLRESCQQCESLYEIQMTQAQQLATMGELAAGLAHEIKNPLAGIAGAIEIISQDLPPLNPHREVMKEVQGEMLRIKKILADLLSYTRPKPPHFAIADLNDSISTGIHVASQQTSKAIEFLFDPDPSLPPVAHDPDLIRQVLLNLLLNSVEAIADRGRVLVEAHTVERTDGRAPEILITITDTGRGIPREQLGQIFKPFFTTKGQGTGLGLSLSKRIIEQHNGRIEVELPPEGGTRFLIRLPLRVAVSEPALARAGSRQA